MKWTIKTPPVVLNDYFFLYIYHALQGEDDYFTQLEKVAEQDFENQLTEGTVVSGKVV